MASTQPDRNRTRFFLRLFGLALGVSAVWPGLVPYIAQAAPANQAAIIQILQNSARVSYLNGIEFKIATSMSGSEVNKAQLKVRFGTRGREAVYEVELMKGAGSYLLNDKSASLVTGMALSYSWVLGDGKVQLQTGPQEVVYEDTRRSWFQRVGPQVTIRWYDGTDAYGNLMYQLASDTLATYKRRFNVDPTDQIYITIYGSSTAYRTTFTDAPAWSGGFARYGGQEIVVIAPQNHNSSIFIGEGIPHELSHAALYQFLRRPAPVWLDEGLAVYNQNTITIKEYDDLVQSAYKSNALLSFASLNKRWPVDATTARLAYAQSRSIVTFLINYYGNEVWSNVLDQMRRHDADGALMEVFGLNLAQVEELWKNKVLAGQPAPMPAALKRGPVSSQISEADLKMQDPNAQLVRQEGFLDGGYLWLFAGLGAIGMVVLVSAAVVAYNRRQRQIERDDPYLQLNSQIYAASSPGYRAAPPLAPAVSPLMTSASPPNGYYQGQAVVPPPLGYGNSPWQPGVWPLRPEAGPPSLPTFPNRAAPATPAGSSGDPFDLIMSQFNAPGQPPPAVLNPGSDFDTQSPAQTAPGSAPLSASTSYSFLDLDPYGLNFGTPPREKEKESR